MVITKEIQLKLERIQIEENPVGHKGKYACYQFVMCWPSQYYFFKEPSKEKEWSVMWGQSPTTTFYTKNYKEWQKLVLAKIKDDLPPSFKLVDVSHWHLAISNYEKPEPQRKWGIFYHAETFYNKDRVKQSCDRHVILENDFMDNIISRLPLQPVKAKAV